MLIWLYPASKKSLWFLTQSLIVALISSETTALGLSLSLVLHTFSLLIPKLSPLFFLFSKEIKNRTPGLALSSNCNQLCLDWSLFYFRLNIFPRCFKYFSKVPCRSTQTLPSPVFDVLFFFFIYSLQMVECDQEELREFGKRGHWMHVLWKERKMIDIRPVLLMVWRVLTYRKCICNASRTWQQIFHCYRVFESQISWGKPITTHLYLEGVM